MGENLMADYYTKRPVKGTGTGGQASATQKKVQEILRWIRALPMGADPVRSEYPSSHHVADLARQVAVADGLMVHTGGRYVRTSKLA
jgi:hypothetical protein